MQEPLSPGGVPYSAVSLTKNPEEKDPSQEPGTNSSRGVLFLQVSFFLSFFLGW